MKICKVNISNFRGIKSASISLDGNVVFVGDNNSGKSTIFEAIDLVMGPERLSRRPVIDEHDFYAGEYLINNVPVEITAEVVIIELNDDQLTHFGNHIEWWNTNSKSLLEGPPAKSTDSDNVVPALRLRFIGSYDVEEDDFIGQTYFSETLREGSQPELVRARDKRKCGFLYLRTLRTGSRALSLERGSLLDIILQLKELRPQMWENVLSQLKNVAVAGDPKLGIEGILTSVQSSLSSLVSFETADKPQIRVSNLTREHLRKVLTVFMGTGTYCKDGTEYAAPYYHQGTGTINTLVLSLLAMIAEMKDNVIFAMEEPETALPPHVQKRVVLSVIEKSTQALFTSHSPYVLEEFPPENILTVAKDDGELRAIPAGIPPAVRPKKYRDEFRKRFCESLLARRVLITEGKTEYDVYTAAARKLQQLHPDKSYAFELLGISLVNAETDTQIAQLGSYYTALNKTVYAVFDKQSNDASKEIRKNVDFAYEAEEHGIENVVLKNIDFSVLLRYGLQLVAENEWPQHLRDQAPRLDMTVDELYDALFKFFKWGKGNGSLADLIEFCSEEEMPPFIKKVINDIRTTIYPAKESDEENGRSDEASPEQIESLE